LKMISIKSVCYIGLIISLVGILLNPFASADLIDPYPNKKRIGMDYSIDNMDMYDDYEFFIYGNIIGYQKLTSNQKISFYKFEQPSICAIKKSELQKTNIILNESIWNNFVENNTKYELMITQYKKLVKRFRD